MKHRRLAHLCTAAATVLVLNKPVFAADPAVMRVKIGVINDATGPLADLAGPGSVIAARLAIEDFRKANAGVAVDLISADHQNKPDVGSQIVRRWFDVDGVDAVFDVGNSAVALAIQSIARERNKLVFYGAVATTEITGRQCARTGLSWLHDSYNLVAGPVRRLVSQGADTWFFIAADYELGRNLVSESQRALSIAHGKMLGAVYHPMINTDYGSFLLQAQASNAKVVAFANVGAQLVNTMKQWREYGMGSTGQVPVAQVMFLTDAYSMGPDVAQGLTALTAWYWDLNDETRPFAARFRAQHRAMPTEAQAAVYSSVLHYLRGVAKADTMETDPVLAVVRSTPVDDFYARGATVRADGKLVHDFNLIRVKPPSQVRQEWDLYEVLQRVPAADTFQPLSESACPLAAAR